MGIIMASEKRRKKSPLAECTNTPNLSRPRRSCCSYASPSTTKKNSNIQSPQSNNPLIDTNYLLAGSNDIQNQNDGHLRGKSSCSTSTKVSPGVRSYQNPQCPEENVQNNGVQSEHREREGPSLQVIASCSPLGRSSLKSKQKMAKFTEPEEQSGNFEDLLSVRQNHNDNKKNLEFDINDKENITIPELILPALYNFQYLDRHEDTDCRKIRVYSKQRQRECRNSEEVSWSCPPFGRTVVESKQKTGGSCEVKNSSKNLENFSTPSSNNRDQNEESLNGNYICKENLSTPQPCVAAIDSFQFPDDNVNIKFENTRFQSILQGSSCRSFEKVSLSCPPLGRSLHKSHTGESTDASKYSSLGAWHGSPVSAIRKMKVQRRPKSVPINKQKHTLPENFIKEQRAHFAEIDAFALEEEENSSDAD